MKKYTKNLILLVLIALTLASCFQITEPTPIPIPPSPTFPTQSKETEISPSPTAVTQEYPSPAFLYQETPNLPPGLLEQINTLQLPQTSEEKKSVFYTIKPGGDHPVASWVYALVAPFPTVREEVSSEWLQDLWLGTLQDNVGTLLISPEDLPAVSSLLGEPAQTVQVAPADQLLERAWTSQNTWAIIPFEKIEPRWKVITIDDQSPIHKDFVHQEYFLSVPFSLASFEADLPPALPSELEGIFLSNLDPAKITTVMLTGVTAMVRSTAVGMDQRGILVPGELIAPIMQEADLLHISNEVPFAENCPPHNSGGYLVFCTPESYMELLRFVGTDIVELTGDHFQDYGTEGMLYTLRLYDEEGWPVYGGGKDIFDARSPVKLEVNGNKLAFIGCNAKSPNFAQASETSSGAYHCDMDYIAREVRALKEEGYLPIVTFQHEERYEWSPNASMVRDFTIAAEAGAVIVSGSQSHVPHYAEFYGSTFFHYGLGNLFFDQYGIAKNTDIGFLDRHVFYDGKYLGVELFPIQFLDKVQARLMTTEERAATLKIMFDTMRMWWKDEQMQPVQPSWWQPFP